MNNNAQRKQILEAREYSFEDTWNIPEHVKNFCFVLIHSMIHTQIVWSLYLCFYPQHESNERKEKHHKICGNTLMLLEVHIINTQRCSHIEMYVWSYELKIICNTVKKKIFQRWKKWILTHPINSIKITKLWLWLGIQRGKCGFSGYLGIK